MDPDLMALTPLLMIVAVFVVASCFDAREACCGFTNELFYRMKYLAGGWKCR